VQGFNLIGMRLFKPSTKQIGKKMVIAVPPTVAVEWHDEKIRLFQLF
jgi:hypothetical protein